MSLENTNTDSDPQIEDPTIQPISRWDDLEIPVNLLRGIYSYGFENPSPIQRIGIKPLIDGRDVIGQAQSGTGKTATFTIGALSKVDVKSDSNQILVLSPTHELSRQTTKVFQSLSGMMAGIRIKTIIGGSSINDDVHYMHETPPHVIIGCPGRVYDMMNRRHIIASQLKMVILDEADEMLSQGFKEQVYNIFQHLNKEVQIALFSATLPTYIYSLTDKFMRNPVKINVAAEKLTLDGIKQCFVALNDDRDKYITLKDLYPKMITTQCIIFCNSVERVIELHTAMIEDAFPVCCIHSKISSEAREQAFAEFRSGSARVLISSNLTARGLDVQQVGIVINFDVPIDAHTYLHRIGRSGRWGRKGIAINFITRRDVSKLKEFETYYKCSIDELTENFLN
jgi:translation initiation factor 4A